jgi:hypothetical protein
VKKNIRKEEFNELSVCDYAMKPQRLCCDVIELVFLPAFCIPYIKILFFLLADE